MGQEAVVQQTGRNGADVHPKFANNVGNGQIMFHIQLARFPLLVSMCLFNKMIGLSNLGNLFRTGA
jgi:hypothetical protein